MFCHVFTAWAQGTAAKNPNKYCIVFLKTQAATTGCRRQDVRLALLETPSGFALFIIGEKVLTYPDAIWAWLTDVREARHLARVIEYIKVEDKSVTRRPDGPGEKLSNFIKKYYHRIENGKELYVEDEKLRRVIHSNLKIKCSDNNYVVGDMMWGLKNVMYDLVFEERDNLKPGFQNLTPCAGLEKCISTYKLSREAIDEKGLPDIIDKAVVFINSLADGRRSVSQGSQMEKRTLSHLAESSCELQSNQDTYDANEGGSKKSRIGESSNEKVYVSNPATSAADKAGEAEAKEAQSSSKLPSKEEGVKEKTPAEESTSAGGAKGPRRLTKPNAKYLGAEWAK
ncbi:hypothetical protein EJB05_08272, partial [Eragrostis curvula]